MGYASYSTINRASYSKTISNFSQREIFSSKLHQTMDSKNVTLREARDSEAHPITIPIIIGLDVTGSMGFIPEHIIKHGLTTIVEGLLEAGVKDPTICFVAIGDQYSDQAPIQIGQFESDDKGLAMWLERTWLEAGGGGGATESYWLAWYFASHFTSTDHWEKRGKKGIIVTIGDEYTHDVDKVSSIFSKQDSKESTTDLLKATKERWEIFHIHANDGSYNTSSYYGERVVAQWKEILGQSVVVVDKHTDIPARMVDLILGAIKTETDKNPSVKSDTPVNDEPADVSDSPTPSML